MAARYGLWDTEAGNSLGFYASQDAALIVVRRALNSHGEEAVAALALDREDESGEGGLIAAGDTLIELAREWPDDRPPASSSSLRTSHRR